MPIRSGRSSQARNSAAPTKMLNGFLPEAGAKFDLKLTPKDLAEGYESDDARNRWFLILEGQRRAIYVL
jgi:hypothetical protein